MNLKKSDFTLASSHLFRRGNKGTIYCRWETAGRDHRHSTGQTEENAARQVAWDKYLEAHGQLPAGTVPARRNVTPTLGAVTDLYLTHIQRITGITPRAARRNVQALARFAWEADLCTGGPNDWRGVRTSALDDQAIATWRAYRRERDGIDPTDNENRAHNARLNGIFQQIKSVWCKQARLRIYRALTFPPSLDLFLASQRLKEPKRKWVPIPAHAIRALEEAIVPLRRTDPARYVIYQLARHCALRSEEILHLRRHWFEEHDAGHYLLRIIEREPTNTLPAFRPKRQDRSIPVPRAQADAWLRLCGDPGPFDRLFPDCPEERNAWDKYKRPLLEIMRAHLPDRRLPLHELRKHRGSEIFTQTKNLDVAAAYLGDTRAVAESYYLTLQDITEVLTQCLVNPTTKQA
jgi:hypothetical protein